MSELAVGVVDALNPENIPDKMSRPELEWWILFTIAVAGKTAKQIEKKMREFFAAPTAEQWNAPFNTPFKIVQFFIRNGHLARELRRVKIGKYALMNKGFRKAVTLDLDLLERSEPADALELLTAVPGLGPKGARMILMYGFPHHANQWVVLDTHILRWLREQGIQDVPKSTPPEGKTYRRLETDFKFHAAFRNQTTRQLDTDIWTAYSRK